MKSKNIKVAYSTRYPQKGVCTVPKIQMEGKWLEDLGFSIGSTVLVEYEEGALRIRPMTEEELLRKDQSILQSQLKKKEKELRLMQASYENLSRVAEASGIYNDSSKSSTR